MLAYSFFVRYCPKQPVIGQFPVRLHPPSAMPQTHPSTCPFRGRVCSLNFACCDAAIKRPRHDHSPECAVANPSQNLSALKKTSTLARPQPSALLPDSGECTRRGARNREHLEFDDPHSRVPKFPD